MNCRGCFQREPKVLIVERWERRDEALVRNHLRDRRIVEDRREAGIQNGKSRAQPERGGDALLSAQRHVLEGSHVRLSQRQAQAGRGNTDGKARQPSTKGGKWIFKNVAELLVLQLSQ